MMSLISYNNRLMSPGVFSLLNDIFSDDYPSSFKAANGKNTVPAVNVKENEKSYALEMAVPGLDKKDINIEVDENKLTISSEVKDEKKEETDNFTKREFHYTSFERSFNLPEGTDAQHIKAKCENGILHLEIPKVETRVSSKKLIEVA